MSNFRDKLRESAQGRGNTRELKLINMQNKDNYGSLVFVPIVPADGSDSVAVLKNVLEVAEEYTYKDRNNGDKEKKGKRFLRLLSLEDYSDLSKAQIDQYKEIRSKAKKLYKHEFSKSKKDNSSKRNGIIRIKDYTIIVGWVIEHRNKADKIVNQNCPALLVFSSSRFDEAFEEAMKIKDKKMGNSDWMARLFNSSLHRKMYMDINYKLSDDPKKIGYIASISIEKFDEDTIRYTGGNSEELDLTSQKDKVDKISNPINLFVNNESENFFSSKTANSIEYQLHRYLNKYCGTTYELNEGDSEEPEATHDPTDYVKKDDPQNLPPEDKPNNPDIWDE